MKRYRVFFLDGNTFDLHADSVGALFESVCFFMQNTLTAQFLKSNIAGWAEIKKS